MASRRPPAGEPSRSIPLLLLVILLHVLLVGALLRAMKRAAPDSTPNADSGVLLLDLPVARDEEEGAPGDDAARPRAAVEPDRPPASARPPRGAAGRDAIRPDASAAAPAQSQSNRSRGTDWYASGEAAARDFAARLDRPSTRPLDRRSTSPKPPVERTPKSVFDDERSKVGRITQNADGETIYWLTPNCYVSLGSDSIALRDVHAMHEGMTFCRIPLGKREARGDLFEEMPTQRGSRYAEKYDPASTEPQPVR